MAKKFTRRDFLKGVSFVAAGSVLAACAPQAAPTNAPVAVQPTNAPAVVQPTEIPKPATGAKTITYWTGWSGDYPKSIDELKQTPVWKQYMGDYDVEVKSAVGEDALLTALAGGTPPDTASSFEYIDYMARDVLRPVDDYVAASKNVKKEDFFDGNWALGTYKGKLYCIPAIECFLRFGTNYNKQMVTDAGLDPTTPPETWDEWLEWHKTLTTFDSAKNLKTIGLDPTDAMGGGLGSMDGWLYQVSYDVEWFDVNTGKFNINNPQMVDYLNTTKKFTDIIGMDNLAGMRKVQGLGSWGGSFDAWAQAIIINGYWFPGETVNAQPTHTPPNMATWAPVPASRKGAKCQLAGGHMVMIFKESKAPDIGYAMTELFNSKTACDITFKAVGWLPALKAYIDTVDPSPYPGLDFYIKSAKEATNWYSPNQCPISSFVGNKWGELREKVNRDQMTADAAAAELQTDCETEYKNAGFGA